MTVRTNAIGLSAAKAVEISAELNELLSNYAVFYQNVRGFHWNIRGDKFFELHGKFEELYTDLQTKIDEIAERILTLGGTPNHSFSIYLETSAVKPAENIKDFKRAIQRILSAFTTILLLQRELLELSAKDADQGTNTLMSEYVRQQEKLVWMYSAYLG
ncbi:MAG: DNA starvation/stationary phase protection protein [Ignavibacteria bacterium]|nr:DNA starvation/stationary phase protection protein [Ignavibacteria bacterium]